MPQRFAILTVLVLLFATPSLADQWDPTFGSAIPAYPSPGSVRDVLVDGDDIYVVSGGLYLSVAKWDGNSWTNLGASLQEYSNQGLPIRIRRFKQWVAVCGIAYVNGQFADVGLWDGTTWSGLNLTISNPSAVYSNDTDLYVSGIDLQSNGGAIRRWDGATETAIPSMMKSLTDFIEWNGNLFVCGVVHFPGPPPSDAFGVVYWDGSQWHLTGDISPLVWPEDLLVYNNELYVGGDGQSGANPVKKWTGTNWVQPFPNLLSCGSATILFHEGRLCRTGVRWAASFSGVAMLKDGSWNNMDGGVNYACAGRLAEYQGRLLVAGGFATAGGMPVPGLGLWDGDNWHSRGLDGGALAMASNGSDVFVTGVFENAFNTPAHRIARWNGGEWSALGSGIDGSAYAAVMMGDDVYVGGEFTDAGGTGAVNLAKWNGSVWSPVGSSLGGPVHALATDGTSIYVGGDFATFQGEFLQGIAQWDGTSFHALGTGISGGSVRAIQLSGNLVYAAGDFTTAGGQFTGNTAVWNGSWNTLGNGINGGMVHALEMFNGALYACGDFYSYPIQRIAYFNGTQWTAIFPGLDGPAYAMESMAGNLYITGGFTKAGGNTVNRIARWNGTAFSTLGSGLDATGRTITAGPAGIWLGGDFKSTGGLGAAHVGHYALSPTAVGPSIAAPMSLDHVFPNPFNPTTNIRYRVGSDSRVTIAIYDVQGRLVRQLLDEDVHGSMTERVITWDGRSGIGTPAASGVYFVRMSAKGYNETRKIVLLK